jgi:hypothetical protein
MSEREGVGRVVRDAMMAERAVVGRVVRDAVVTERAVVGWAVLVGVVGRCAGYCRLVFDAGVALRAVGRGALFRGWARARVGRVGV